MAASALQQNSEPRAPSARLIAGLIFTLLVICGYAAHTIYSVRQMREVQTRIIEQNRLASLQLLRIQNDLNALALAMRDMLDRRDGYPLSAWRPALQRIQENLNDAIRREAALSEGQRDAQATAYLETSFQDFWRSWDAILAAPGGDTQALLLIRDSLQPRQEALTALIARLLVQNSERESAAARDVAAVYAGIERNAYLFLGASVLLIAVTSLTLIRANRKLFAHLAALASQRRELARQLISTQESTLRSISRDLHDEFGQVLTGLGAMLQRAGRRSQDTELQRDLRELATIVQETLDKIRALSQTLQPVILEEQGLLAAIRWSLSVFERHSGIRVAASLPEQPIELGAETSIHAFRILQESLNNVARHAGVEAVDVTVAMTGEEFRLMVADHGCGIPEGKQSGIGLAGMRERAELIGGRLSVTVTEGGGTTVSLVVPIADREARVPAAPHREVQVG